MRCRNEKSKLDGYYVKNMSLGLDIKCFLGTFLSVARSEGVVEGGTGVKAKAETNSNTEKSKI